MTFPIYQKKITESLDSYFDHLLVSKRIPGCGLKVRKDGQLIYDRCFGLADLENSLPVSDDTLFALASMTKPITAVAAMRLVEDKKLSLDDCLLKYFPHYPTEKQSVTVRHLLNHCSGLGQGPASNQYFIDHAFPDDSLADRINRLQDIPFDYQPGESAQYSPVVGFEILSRIIELAADMPLEEYMAAEIFRPLGMRDTGFCPGSENRSRTAKIYNSIAGQLVPASMNNPLLATIFSNECYHAGCGGLFGTLQDYDRFTTMLASNGQLDGIRILKESSLIQMRTPRQLTAATHRPGLPWGLGMMVFEEPEKSNFCVAPGTFGWSGAFGTHMFVSPSTGLSATFMINMGDLNGALSPISRQIEKIVFQL